MTIVEFLLARIVEDEECAGDGDDLSGPAYVEGYGDYALMGGERLRAECAAKRAIVHDAEGWARLGDRAETAGMQALARFTRDDATLRHLATVYADHPDYRQEWKP